MTWVKSSRSMANGNCVEVARSIAGILVRDSQNPQGAILAVRRDDWMHFISKVKAS